MVAKINTLQKNLKACQAFPNIVFLSLSFTCKGLLCIKVHWQGGNIGFVPFEKHAQWNPYVHRKHENFNELFPC